MEHLRLKVAYCWIYHAYCLHAHHHFLHLLALHLEFGLVEILLLGLDATWYCLPIYVRLLPAVHHRMETLLQLPLKLGGLRLQRFRHVQPDATSYLQPQHLQEQGLLDGRPPSGHRQDFLLRQDFQELLWHRRHADKCHHRVENLFDFLLHPSLLIRPYFHGHWSW